MCLTFSTFHSLPLCVTDEQLVWACEGGLQPPLTAAAQRLLHQRGWAVVTVPAASLDARAKVRTKLLVTHMKDAQEARQQAAAAAAAKEAAAAANPAVAVVIQQQQEQQEQQQEHGTGPDAASKQPDVQKRPAFTLEDLLSQMRAQQKQHLASGDAEGARKLEETMQQLASLSPDMALQVLQQAFSLQRQQAELAQAKRQQLRAAPGPLGPGFRASEVEEHEYDPHSMDAEELFAHNRVFLMHEGPW